jgi:folate-binding protein YgfZ
VVRVSGPDAVGFLQGQLSQDIESLAIGRSAWSLLLQPTGKVDAWLRVTRDEDDAMILDVDGGWGDALLQRLNRFKLRTKCEIEPVAGWRCLAVRNTNSEIAPDDATARPIVWPGTTGADLLGPDGQPQPPLDINLADYATYERARIEAGVPALGRELTEATIPVEAGQWLVDASVSFTKGCFTGQELVARIDSRGGNAPRPVRGLRIEGPANPGDEVVAAGKTVGAVTSAASTNEAEDEDDNVTVALAPLSRTIAAGTDVQVGGHPARVVPLPMA